MKIGIVLSAIPGYSETFFRNKIKVLQQQGHQVVLYTPYSDQQTDLNVCMSPRKYNSSLRIVISIVYHLFKLSIKSPLNVKRFYKTELQNGKKIQQVIKNLYFNSHLLQSKLDWIHYGFATLAIDRENIAYAIDAKMAISFRGYDINVYPLKFPKAYNRIWDKLDKVHSISDDLYHKAVNLGLNSSIPYMKITPAIDVDYFKFEGAKKYATDHIKIFTVARLTWIKGIDYAISAMRLLADKGISFTYTIAGDGVVYDRIMFAVHQYKLTNHVIFLGAVNKDEILQHMVDSDIYVQPSLEEGFCNAVLEAQSCKCLCIASNVGGLRENIIHKITGWLVPKRSPKALAETIEKVIQLSSKEKEKIAQAAADRVVKSFSLSIQQKAFAKFYN